MQDPAAAEEGEEEAASKASTDELQIQQLRHRLSELETELRTAQNRANTATYNVVGEHGKPKLSKKNLELAVDSTAEVWAMDLVESKAGQISECEVNTEPLPRPGKIAQDSKAEICDVDLTASTEHLPRPEKISQDSQAETCDVDLTASKLTPMRCPAEASLDESLDQDGDSSSSLSENSACLKVWRM